MLVSLFNVLNSVLLLVFEVVLTWTFKVLAFVVEQIPTFVYYLLKCSKTLMELVLALSPVLPMPLTIPATSVTFVINWPIVLIPLVTYLVYKYSVRRILKDIGRFIGYVAVITAYWFLRTFGGFLKNQGEHFALKLRKIFESAWNESDRSVALNQKKRRQTAMF